MLSKDTAAPVHYHVAIFPAVGYTLQTGFAGILSANIGYHNGSSKDEKISSLSTSITYSQYNQVIVPVLADIWTKNNGFNFISDNRYIKYPSDIYGLGGHTDPNKGITIDFSAIKLHQTILKSVAKNIYAGVGFYYDQYWNIKAIDPETRRINTILQRELGDDEIASGFTLRALYDNRTNQINADQGWYANVVYRNNRKFLGSSDTWQSLLIDVRKYFHFPGSSHNVLAFWSYNWMTVGGGNPPYLLLPSTGWDDQYNTGRGYIQGRFRGKNMYYLESEYRFRISRNGLLGGVVFANVEKFSGELSEQFNELLPACGAGLRIKLNKHSGANICVDYGIGKDGSNGFFVNLGEVF
ncbi:hypothetical protein F5148DRAFT_986655 [Russula earlei]|uniref:Uncharacterized protein n=1 Tax=Russula earlei TaxID=71964 RepID=A0ACC0TVV4_9AGAM|nr:hypothetical protein F5148DRAFT_986655 [Russula earlei]